MTGQKRVGIILGLALVAALTGILATLGVIPMWAAGVTLFVTFMIAHGLQSAHDPKHKKRKWS